MSSAVKALAIPELLEKILAHLPPLNIIRCQCVNHTWKTVIADSPLLQYKTWQRRTYKAYVDPRVMPNIDDSDDEDLWKKRYLRDINAHLHPLVTSIIMKHLPSDFLWQRFKLEKVAVKDEGGEASYKSYHEFNPDLLQGMVQWYEQNKATISKWGHMPLCRPGIYKLESEISSSDDAGTPFSLEAGSEHDSGADETNVNHTGADNESPVIRLGEFFRAITGLWESWLDWEREVHWLGHDGGYCDYDQGLPDQCLDSSDDDDENDEEEEKDSDEEASKDWKKGTKMTLEEHIDDLVYRASH